MRACLRIIITNEAACKHSWFGQHGNIVVKKFKVMNLTKGKFCENNYFSFNSKSPFFSRMCHGTIANSKAGGNYKHSEGVVPILERPTAKDGES